MLTSTFTSHGGGGLGRSEVTLLLLWSFSVSWFSIFSFSFWGSQEGALPSDSWPSRPADECEGRKEKGNKGHKNHSRRNSGSENETTPENYKIAKILLKLPSEANTVASFPSYLSVGPERAPKSFKTQRRHYSWHGCLHRRIGCNRGSHLPLGKGVSVLALLSILMHSRNCSLVRY